jgi:hypothetical protein
MLKGFTMGGTIYATLNPDSAANRKGGPLAGAALLCVPK